MITLGIDFGGTGIKSALVDCNTGDLVTERLRFHTPHKAHPDDVVNVIHKLILQPKWSGRLGIGFPAVIKHGVAMNAANISKKWIGINVVDLITHQTGCQAAVINDADAAGLAEMTFGVGKGFKDEVVLMLTVGTGIGTSIFVRGNLLPNTEFGHLLIRGKDAEKLSSDFVRREKNLSWKKWAKKFQEFLGEMEKLVNPDVIIVGGGISKHHQDFFNLLDVKARLLPAKYLNNAGIIGAALFASWLKN
jgi:polyphosphate glucokinase